MRQGSPLRHRLLRRRRRQPQRPQVCHHGRQTRLGSSQKAACQNIKCTRQYDLPTISGSMSSKMVLQILRVTNLPLFHAKPLPRYSSGFADGCLGPHEGGVVEVQIRRTRGTGDTFGAENLRCRMRCHGGTWWDIRLSSLIAFLAPREKS